MSLRSRATALLGLAVAVSGVPLLISSPANADVSSKIATFPYTQDWSNGGLITTNDDWSGVSGVQGYRGDDVVTAAGVDPQTILADGSTSPTNVIANTTVSSTTGGILEIDGNTIAMQGSGTADVPHLVLHLDLTGKTGATFAFNAKDLDSTADNAVQQVAVQYRVGTTGAYTNLPDGYIADATTAGSATQVTAKSVPLPAAADGKSDVFVRVLTTNATGNDELVGIDDINITAGGGTATPGVVAADPGDKTVTVNQPIANITLSATGGTGTYTYAASGLPAGLTLANGVISGTPTVTGTFPVTITATDSANPPVSDTEEFVITVAAANAVTPITTIQGTGTASTLVGTAVTTRGIVTAAYPSGGLFGFYLQTPGTGGATDVATRTASDAVFVRQTTAAGAVTVTPGQFVEVTGTVTEFANQTQVEVTSAANIKTATGTAAPVTATTSTFPATAAQKEALEGMLYRPAGNFTITDNYNTGGFGELILAQGSTTLRTPTDVARPGAPAQAIAADNAARRIVLDDGASTNFGTVRTVTPAYISNTKPFRVGATAQFSNDVILTEGGSSTAPTYRFQPLAPVIGPDNAATPITFPNTRSAQPSEANLSADGTPAVKVASFNVLNYFTTLGDANDDNVGDGGCTPFTDRAGDGNNVQGGCDQRGAWDPQDFARQQSKIVSAINALDADVVGLMEIENSRQLGETADEATNALVAALNSAAGAGTWAANPSSADLPAAGMDVINNAIIYKPASVTRTGAARALGNLSEDNQAFGNAREPIAQAFTPVGGGKPFLVVVNHFKSKGSGVDDGTGQGNANPDRVRQATALKDWVPTIQTALGVQDTLLVGDFNSYTREDPMEVLYTAGYSNAETVAELASTSYSFGGESGSLDHILMNASALQRFTGADIWDINADEPLLMEYSRYNYTATDFHTNGPWRSSDHDPVVVGLAGTAAAAPVALNLLNLNDFHGRIDGNATTGEGLTTQLATKIEELRAAAGESSTLLLSSGDLIGASLFNSSAQDDNPTTDVLNVLGLASSAVGNHEFDKGAADLTGRVSTRANWNYLGANVYAKGTQTPALPEFDVFTVNGIRVGVIGAVTQETPGLVAAGGVANLDFGDPVDAVNRVATKLTDGDAGNGEADVLIAEYHEGGPVADGATTPGSSYAANVAASAVFAKIANQTSPKVDVIFNGHTHQPYAIAAPVTGGDLATRPILQTGQYGDRVGQVQLTVDPTTKKVLTHTQQNVARGTVSDVTKPRVAAVRDIVKDAITKAAVVGNQPVGTITADITTAFTGAAPVNGTYAGGARDNRTAESTLGNLVAQAYLDGLPASVGTADIGIVNPGGLRAELFYAGDTSANPANTDGVVTFAEAVGVVPFANNMSLVSLTGAQLKTVLEQQWRVSGTTTSYLQLGLSNNVQVTADASRAQGNRITSVRINGALLDPARTYRISTATFLSAGGDSFTGFTAGTARDTGLVDRDLFVSYLQSAGKVAPDFARQQVFETGMPATITSGQAYSFTLGTDVTAPAVPNTGETLDLTSLGSPANTTVVVYADNGTTSTRLGEFPVTNGTATISFTAPAGLTGTNQLAAFAKPSGTYVGAPLSQKLASAVSATAPGVTAGTAGTATVLVSSDAAPTGLVQVSNGDTVVGTGRVSLGKALVSLSSTLPAGTYTLTARYLGDSATAPASTTFTYVVAPAPVTPPTTPPTTPPVTPPVTPPTTTPVPQAPPVVTIKLPNGSTVTLGSRPVIKLRLVAPDGTKLTGKVKIKVAGLKTKTVKIKNGKIKVRLAALRKLGATKVKVVVPATATTPKVKKTIKLVVKRR